MTFIPGEIGDPIFIESLEDYAEDGREMVLVEMIGKPGKYYGKRFIDEESGYIHIYVHSLNKTFSFPMVDA